MAEAHPGNYNNDKTFHIKTVDGAEEEHRGSALRLVVKSDVPVLELWGHPYSNLVCAELLRSWPLSSVLSYWEV